MKSFSINSSDDITMHHTNAHCYKALVTDIDEIVNIYSHMDQVGLNNLVEFPENILFASVKKNIHHIFVYKDQLTGRIISLLKLKSLTQVEKKEVLDDELHCLDYKKQIAPVFSGALTQIKKDDTNIPQSRLVFDLPNSENVKIHDDQLVIYYGGAYTLPEYRQKRMNYYLLNYAIKYLADNDLNKKKNEHSEIVFCFGQVLSESKNNSPIRYFIQSFLNYNDFYHKKDWLHLSFIGYRAFKPVITITDDKEIQVTFPKENEGIGKCLIFKR